MDNVQIVIVTLIYHRHKPIDLIAHSAEKFVFSVIWWDCIMIASKTAPILDL
jgi:hypothetical protein